MSPDLKLAAGALGGLLLGLLLGGLIHPAAPDVRTWENRVRRYEADSLASQATIARLATERDAMLDSARQAETARAAAVVRASIAAANGQHARRRADSLVAVLDAATTAADSLPLAMDALRERTLEAQAAGAEAGHLRQALDAQLAASGRLEAAFHVERSRGDSLAHRLALADDLLRDRPATDRCRILLWNCPSRTASAIGGVVVGVAGTLLLRH